MFASVVWLAITIGGGRLPSSLSFPPARAGLEASDPALLDPMLGSTEIVYGKIVFHNGGKYLCGRAKLTDGRPGFRRYLFSLETDWQYWEPMMDNEDWPAWEAVYHAYCEEKK